MAVTSNRMPTPDERAPAAGDDVRRSEDASPPDQAMTASPDDACQATPERPHDLVTHLKADIQNLRSRDDQLHQRLLDQVERRHAVNALLQAERFKVAALERDLRMTQAALKRTQEKLTALQHELHAIYSSRVWRLGRAYWGLRGKLTGR